MYNSVIERTSPVCASWSSNTQTSKGVYYYHAVTVYWSKKKTLGDHWLKLFHDTLHH